MRSSERKRKKCPNWSMAHYLFSITKFVFFSLSLYFCFIIMYIFYVLYFLLLVIRKEACPKKNKLEQKSKKKMNVVCSQLVYRCCAHSHTADRIIKWKFWFFVSFLIFFCFCCLFVCLKSIYRNTMINAQNQLVIFCVCFFYSYFVA